MYTLVFLHCSKIGRRNVLPILSFCHGGRKCSRSGGLSPPSFLLLWLPIPIETIVVSFYQVADSRGHTLFRKEDASKGKFAFTTEDYELFEVCFLTTVTGEPRLKSVATCTQHTHAHTQIHIHIPFSIVVFSWGKIFVELCSVALQKFYVLNFFVASNLHVSFNLKIWFLPVDVVLIKQIMQKCVSIKPASMFHVSDIPETCWMPAWELICMDLPHFYPPSSSCAIWTHLWATLVLSSWNSLKDNAALTCCRYENAHGPHT